MWETMRSKKLGDKKKFMLVVILIYINFYEMSLRNVI